MVCHWLYRRNAAELLLVSWIVGVTMSFEINDEKKNMNESNYQIL